MDLEPKRRVYNIGPHGSSYFDASSKRYDQYFDSQPSRASHENSQDFGSSRAYDSGHTPLRKAETDVHAAQKTKPFAKEPRDLAGTHLEKIEEDKSSLAHSAVLRRAQPPNLGDSLARSDALLLSLRAGAGDLLIQSSKLDESVKAPERPPSRVGGLTDFLTDQHHLKTGVYKRDVKTLHDFWKGFVSLAYKDLRERCRPKDASLAQDVMALSLGTKQQPKEKAGRSDLLGTRKPGGDKENYGKTSGKEKLSDLYDVYGRLFEVDVVFTLEKDLQEELDRFKE